MPKKYTMEKTLYFANREEALHVAIDEPKDSDLSINVRDALVRDLVMQVATDDSGRYFTTTKKGKVELLRMQINWRKQNGKDTCDHEQELSRLVA